MADHAVRSSAFRANALSGKLNDYLQFYHGEDVAILDVEFFRLDMLLHAAVEVVSLAYVLDIARRIDLYDTLLPKKAEFVRIRRAILEWATGFIN